MPHKIKVQIHIREFQPINYSIPNGMEFLCGGVTCG